MKGRIVSQVVAVIGLIVLSVTVAQAGSGSGGQALTLWFECRSINGGTNVGDNVSILDPSGAPVLEPNAIVGMSVLACRQVQVQLKGSPGVLPAFTGDHLKCYTLAVQGKSDTSNFTFTDAFGTEQNITVLGSRYLCATAVITE
jgi:hypothetical protein